MNIPVQEILNKTIREGREKREITSWQVSKLGSCLRGIYLERLGVKPDREFDDRTLRVFNVGKMFEDWFISLLGQKGLKAETQVRVEDLELNVSGYADLVAEYKGEKKVYEIKTKHSNAFHYMRKEGKPMRQHQYQSWIYLYLLGIKEGAIIYLSKDDLSILEYPVFLNDKSIEDEITKELFLLNWAWQKKDPTLLPLPEEEWKGRYCRFHKSCIALDK